MNVLAIHPIPERLRELTESIHSVHPEYVVNEFKDQMLAVKYGFNNQVDSVYTPVKMRPINGFDVVRLLRSQNGNVLVNFIASDNAERKDAMRFGMDSFTVEPVTADKLRAAERDGW